MSTAPLGCEDCLKGQTLTVSNRTPNTCQSSNHQKAVQLSWKKLNKYLLYTEAEKEYVKTIWKVYFNQCSGCLRLHWDNQTLVLQGCRREKWQRLVSEGVSMCHSLKELPLYISSLSSTKQSPWDTHPPTPSITSSPIAPIKSVSHLPFHLVMLFSKIQNAVL